MAAFVHGPMNKKTSMISTKDINYKEYVRQILFLAPIFSITMHADLQKKKNHACK